MAVLVVPTNLVYKLNGLNQDRQDLRPVQLRELKRQTNHLNRQEVN